jgi:hypothetical protein
MSTTKFGTYQLGKVMVLQEKLLITSLGKKREAI